MAAVQLRRTIEPRHRLLSVAPRSANWRRSQIEGRKGPKKTKLYEAFVCTATTTSSRNNDRRPRRQEDRLIWTTPRHQRNATAGEGAGAGDSAEETVGFGSRVEPCALDLEGEMETEDAMGVDLEGDF